MSPKPASIVAGNPSHATEIERAFWASLAATCADNGSRLVQFAARTIPDLLSGETQRIPPTLAGLFTEGFTEFDAGDGDGDLLPHG